MQIYALGYKLAIFQLRAHFRAQKGKMEGKNDIALSNRTKKCAHFIPRNVHISYPKTYTFFPRNVHIFYPVSLRQKRNIG